MRSVEVSGTEPSPFERLRSGLQGLREEDLHAVPASCMADDLVELRRHINGCEAEFIRRLRRFDTGEGYFGSGIVGTKPWLVYKCNLSPSVASDRVEVSRQLASMPQTADAFAEGDISYQHAAMIARTAERLGDRMEGPAETVLVTAAKELDPSHLRMVTLKLRHCIDPDGLLSDANEAHELRHLYLNQTLDGVFYLNGRLDPEGGAIIQTALNALMGPPSLEDQRSLKQRRADALVELTRQSLDRGELPEVGGQRPHLAVTVDMATLANQPGSPAAELEWAQPIPVETARRLACDAAVTPIFMDAESNQPRADRTQRLVTGSQRRALVVRDRGCRFPGCDRPPDWTDAHHIRHWAEGGDSRTHNLVLLCRRHHRMVHEEGWQLSWGDEGRLVAIPP